MNFYKVLTTPPTTTILYQRTTPDLPRQPIHLLLPLSPHQSLNRLLLPPHFHHPNLPMDLLQHQHPHNPLGSRRLPSLRSPMPPPKSLLGPKRRRPVHRRLQPDRRQPDIQRVHGFRPPRPPHPPHLGSPPRLARQTRHQRRLRSRWLRLLREYIPRCGPLLDQGFRHDVYRLSSYALDAY